MTGAVPSARTLDPERYTVLKRMCAREDHRLVLSLGGGAHPGLCGNLALISILQELELRPHVTEIWGTSAGAVVGGGWATGSSAEEILALVAGLDRRGALDFSLLRFALGVLMAIWPFRRPLPDGLIRGKWFRDAISRGLRVENIEDCEIPFRCIACSDDGTGRRKVFRRGPLLPAIFSSMSIPGIVIPMPGDAEGNCYYDGGLVEKTPLISPIAAHTQSGDPRKLLLLCTHYASEPRKEPARGFLHRFLDTIHVIEDVCWGYQLAEARQRKDVTLMVLNPHIDDPSLFNFARTDRSFREAKATFAELLENARIATTFGLA